VYDEALEQRLEYESAKGFRIVADISYDYICLECGHTFDNPPGPNSGELRCPRCGDSKVERQKYLFCGVSAEGLAEEEYFAAALEP